MLRGATTAIVIAVLLFGVRPVLAGQLLVVSQAENKLAFYDAESGTLLGSANTGRDPREVLVTPDKRRAYVSDFSSSNNTISLFDIKTHSLEKQIEIGGIWGPHGMAMTDDGKNFYVTFEKSSAVGRIDPVSGKLAQTIKVNMRKPHMAELSPDNKWLFVANQNDNNVTWIDVATGKIIKHIFAGKVPLGMAVTDDNTKLWVCAQASNLVNIIDLVGTRKMEANLTCQGGPTRIEFTTDGKHALVTSWKLNQLFVFDTETQEIVKGINTGKNPMGIEMTPDGRFAYIAMVNDNLVGVVDLETLEFVRQFETLARPTGIAYVE